MFDKIISNPLYRYVGMAIVILISVYITGQCLNYQNYIIEGLANHKRDNIVDKDHYAQLDQELKNLNEKKRDTLLIRKYKSQFEDLLIEVNENTNIQLLQNINEYANSLVQNKNENKNSKKYLENINNLYNLNRALNSVMKYVDNQ